MPELSRPHYTKLTACLKNLRLPEADRERLEEAVRKYHEWIAELESTERGQADTVEKLVEATNRYKRFIELDLIFDSSDIRQEYRTPAERQLHRQEYIDFLDSSKYYPDVFQRMIDKIQALIDDTSPSIQNVLNRGHF